MIFTRRLSHYTDFSQDFSHDDTIFLCDLAKTFQDWAKTFQKSRLKKSRFFSQSLGKSPLTDQVSEKSLSFGKSLSLGKSQNFSKILSKTFSRLFPRLWLTIAFYSPRLSHGTDIFQDFNMTPIFYSKKDSFFQDWAKTF